MIRTVCTIKIHPQFDSLRNLYQNNFPKSNPIQYPLRLDCTTFEFLLKQNIAKHTMNVFNSTYLHVEYIQDIAQM